MTAVDVSAGGAAFAVGAPKALFAARAGSGGYFYAPSADGKRFLVSTMLRESAEAPPLTVVVNWLAGVKK